MKYFPKMIGTIHKKIVCQVMVLVCGVIFSCAVPTYISISNENSMKYQQDTWKICYQTLWNNTLFCSKISCLKPITTRQSAPTFSYYYYHDHYHQKSCWGHRKTLTTCSWVNKAFKCDNLGKPIPHYGTG